MTVFGTEIRKHIALDIRDCVRRNRSELSCMVRDRHWSEKEADRLAAALATIEAAAAVIETIRELPAVDVEPCVDCGQPTPFHYHVCKKHTDKED